VALLAPVPSTGSAAAPVLEAPSCLSFCNPFFYAMYCLTFLSTAIRSLSSNISIANKLSTSLWMKLFKSSSSDTEAQYLFLNFVTIRFFNYKRFLSFFYATSLLLGLGGPWSTALPAFSIRRPSGLADAFARPPLILNGPPKTLTCEEASLYCYGSTEPPSLLPGLCSRALE